MRTRRIRASRSAQRGAALILAVTVLVVGVAWYAVGALGNAASGAAQREIRTGQALHAAKRALLGYVALKAADATEDTPGRLPCPESVGQPGTAAEGIAAPVVVPSFPTCSAVGRLPWRTLGIDQPRDGSGEPLWYVVPTGTWALVNSGTVLSINPGLANQLTLDGQPNAVVALIIAPGAAVNSMSEPGAPPGVCAKVNQQTNRYAVPYDPLKFLECGNATGSYVTAGNAPWSNDRVLAITAAEVMDAIAGAVADRLQRQVAPALADWRSNESNTNWGRRFLPYASSFNDPLTNGLCGTYNVRWGLMPVTRSATSSCTNWSGGTVSQIAGLLVSASCAQVGGNYQCQFTNNSAVSPLTARIRATAPNTGQSFRAPIGIGSINSTGGGSISSFTLLIDTSSGDADIDFRVSFPLLSLGTVITVTFPNLPDAALLADARMTWFVKNDWARHAYYVVARGSRLETGATCSGPGDSDCVTVNGLPASTGFSDDKRFIVALMGLALGTQSRSCATDTDSDGVMDCNERDQYIESRDFAATYHQGTIDTVFNDRLATCPFLQTPPAPAATVTICN